ncbi:MAG: hypothetical protein IPP53_12460 [Bacteroidetes bacterium]|nr:hypothetical protein [Bacteroidota bacterium]
MGTWKHPAGGSERLYINSTVFGEKYGYLNLNVANLNFVADHPLKPKAK